ncbi:MAG TPA: ATP-binding protein [Candidatus Binatia bacterium]|nr:ATP-binding protein [Candidatus Binatia bacterium]
MRVLLVEDSEDDALIIRESLPEATFEIEWAERFAAALERLAKSHFDAVLLDLSLPDAYGLDTICRMQSQAARVPIVVLTGLDDEETALKAVERGAQDFLIKGQVNGPLLARSLRYAVQRHRAEEALKERNRELLVLRRISEVILGSLDLNFVLGQILEQAIQSGSFDLGNIRLLDSTGETLEVAVARGYRDPQNILSHRKISRTAEATRSSHFGQALFERPFFEEDVSASAGLRTFKKEGVRSFVGVPVRAENEVLGILQLASRTPRRFRPEELRLWETLGNQMGIAVQRARLYEETRRQARELERANQLQADFSAMIAHDLRSPLVNILGVVEVMMQGVFGAVTEEQSKWLGRLQANARGLVDLIGDFLDLSKLESGYIDLQRQRVALGEIIERSIENFRLIAANRKISLRGTVDSALPPVDADPRRLDQVLNNLISNAIKFTPEGGEVEVAAASAGHDQARLSVRDNGEGIAPEEIGQIFEKYRQGGNVRQAKEKGTGLGLVICKMIVEAHGGRIWAESEPGRGSVFYVSLPLAKEEQGAATLA